MQFCFYKILQWLCCHTGRAFYPAELTYFNFNAYFRYLYNLHSSVLNLLMLPNILSNITRLIRDFRLHFIITQMIHFTKLFYHMQQWAGHDKASFFQGVCVILLLYENKQTKAYVCQFCHSHLQCFCFMTTFAVRCLSHSLSSGAPPPFRSSHFTTYLHFHHILLYLWFKCRGWKMNTNLKENKQ